MANCLTQRDFERYDSGELALAESDAMRGHLSACGACRTAHKQHRERIARESYAPRTPTDVTQSITPEKRHTAASASRRGDKTVPNIDGYKIMGVLGQGGMGIVYRAIQVKLNRTVALKVLPAMVGSASTSAVTRFRREATSAARLHHTHIIPVYDFGESPDGYYYAMELITGHPLDTLIRRFDEQDATSAALGRLGKILRSTVPEAVTTHSTDGTAVSSSADLSVTTTASAPGRHTAYYKYVARWMADAADALHYAHGQGIMHRDIKPANLILSTHGRIMVADFGLAKSSDSETVTQTGSLLGTLRYMSPEQAMARRVRVDYRTDVYSLGATMYELLCFKPAFPGDDDKAILGDIISRDPVRPRKLTPACPPELDTICMKCLEKSPAGRYDSAKALEDDLLRFINDLPIAARRPGAVRRTGKLIRRHKAASVAVGAIFLLCGVAALAVHFNHQRREAAAAGQRQKLAALRQEKLAVQAEAHEIVMQGIQVFQSPTATPAATVAKLERACKYYHAALERVPSQWRALGELARAKKELYNYQTDPDPALLDEAYALCGQALALKPRHADLWNLKGVIAKKLNHLDEAVEAYHRATELDPKSVYSVDNLGVAQVLAGDLAAAEPTLRRASKLAGTGDPCNAPAWRDLAALQFFHRNAAAETSLDQALHCGPGELWTMVLRARRQLVAGDRYNPQRALFTMEDAESLAHRRPRVQRILALAHLRNTQLEPAERHARMAIEYGDSLTPNLLISAIARARLGDRAAAETALAEALAAWPDELKADNSFLATAPSGALWFDTAEELKALHAEAREAIGRATP